MSYIFPESRPESARPGLIFISSIREPWLVNKNLSSRLELFKTYTLGVARHIPCTPSDTDMVPFFYSILRGVQHILVHSSGAMKPKFSFFHDVATMELATGVD